MDELSQKWKDLSDISQATIIELMAGKHQGNIFSSLMANFDTARNALETSLNSSGSAMAEHAKWSDSLEARINKLKASWQSLAQTFMKSDFLKTLINLLAGLVDVIEKVVDNFGLFGTIGIGVIVKGIIGAFKHFKAGNEAAEAISNVASASTDAAEAVGNVASAATESGEALANTASAATETTEAVTNTTSAVTETNEALANTASTGTEVAETMGNVASTTSETAETMANTASAVTETNEALANTASAGTEAAEAIGNVASAGTEAAETIANTASGASEFVEAAGNVTSTTTEVTEAVVNASGAVVTAGTNATKAAGGFKAFATSAAGITLGIGLAIAAIGLIVNAYKKAKEEASELRQETIKASDEFLDSASSFEKAYIKYSGRTDLTTEEEKELESAIKGTVDALDDKSSALQNAVNSSNDYVASLEAIADAELKAAERAAKNKREAAEQELKDIASGWTFVDGNELDLNALGAEAASIAREMNSRFVKSEKQSAGYGNRKTEWYATEILLPDDADVNDIVEYYDFLIEYKNKLSDAELIDSPAYTKVTNTIDKLTESVEAYISGVYDAAKAQYQLANGIPKTVDAYLKMRESILNEVGGTLDTRKTIAGSLDTEYGQYFDLTTAEVQARKLIGVLDKYGDNEATQMETFLNMRTAVNNNECTVGDYMSQFDDINKMTEGWGDKEKEELNTSFGLDTDTIKHQYDEVVKSYMRTFDAASGNLSGVQENFEKSFLDSLSANELAAVFNLKAEIDWQNDSFDNILKQIEEEAKLIEAISFSINLELEAEKLENLSTAISESVSGAGLGTESMSLVEDMFGDLDGYDQSKLFERTANGIRLNSDELRKLNDEYKNKNVDGLNDKVDALGERYLQTREELSDLTYGTEEYNNKARELSDIEAQINAAEKLAAQYRGLSSAYNEWQRAEAAGSQRDMYEGMIEGFENVGDEISRGWIDDGTIEFLELIKGEKATIVDANGVAKEIDIATASAKELKQVWKDLDKNIEHTSYSVRDFFTVDEDGNSTADGVYNFLDAIGQMEEEKFGGKDVVKRNDKGKIIAFDFQIAGGDKAIAEALGISEELVQIMKRAADDAGFVVSMDGTYQQLDVLKKKAAEAAKKLKEEFKSTKYSFFQDGSEKGIKKDYDEALKVWETFKKNKNEDGTIDMTVKGAEEAYTLVSTLQSMVDQLSEPVYMELNASQVEKDMQTPLSKLQEYETLVQTEHQLQLKGTDTSQIETDKEKIIDYFDELQENKPEIAAELGIEGLSREEIQAKVEAGEIEIPATIDLQVEMNNTLRDMVNISLYNAGLLGDKNGEGKTELEKRVDIGVYADKIDTSDVEEKTEDAVDKATDGNSTRKQNVQIIADVIGVEDVNDLSSKLKGLDDKTIQAIAEVLGKIDVDSLKLALSGMSDVQVQAIAEAIGKGDVEGLQSVISGLDSNTVQAIAQAFGYDDVNQLNTAIENLDPKVVQAIAQALGLSDVNTLQSTVNNMQGNTVDAKVNTDGQAGKVNVLQTTINGMQGNTVTAGVNTDGQASKIDTLQTKINSLKGKIVNVGVQLAAGGKKKAAQRTGADPAGNDSEVNGTAHVNGTTGRAFKQGSWGTKNSGTALVGELGREVLVRDGRYYTIGDNGAEFIRYKKGDIIFNHIQSEELFKNGKVTSGGGRARAFVSGTAFDSGTGGGEYGGSAVGSNDKDKDKTEETFDWIETLLSRLERTIDNLDKTVNNTYKSWSDRNAALTDEISEIGKLIGKQESAYNAYMAEANKVGLDDSWAGKVRNGTIDIDTITDENLAEKIKDYETWYEKALAAKDAIVDLKQTEAELYQQRFENVQSQYNGILQGFEHTESMLNEYVSQAEAKGHIVSKNYYQALINNERANIAELRKEQSALIAKRDEAVASGAIVKGSQAWYDMCAEIDGVTQAIEEGNAALIEYANSIRDIDWQVFDLIQERISDVTAEADFLIDLMSYDKLFDDNGKLTDKGMATMGLHGQNYNAYMYQADDYGAKVKEIDDKIASGELDGYSRDVIDKRREYVELQRESILAAEDEKQAIKDLVEEGINLELEALQERIDLHNEELESMKDLYDYQKNVQEQTENIASLQKQLHAYEGFNDEETRATVQKLKVELESAQQDLQETEYDKYIADQTALLDELFLEYENVLNTRLENTDGLVREVIAGVNAAAGAIGEDGVITTALGSEGAIAKALGSNATTIKSTLETEAKNVGTTLSTAMKGIWSVDEGNAKSVITEYGKGFQDKQTTTNAVLGDIKTYVNRMVDDVDKDATTKVNSNKTTTSAKKNPTKNGTTTTTKPTTTNKTSGDGKPKIGDKVTFLSGQYYYDSQGKTPLGSKNHGKQVYITNINTKSWATHPYHISTGKKLGQGDLGWLKLNQISGYATGKKNFLNDEIAWTQENGQEFIVRPSDGAILTPIAKGDSVLTSAASSNIWDMANSPADFIKDNLNLGTTGVPNNSNVNNSYSQHIDNVVFRMDNVKNYEELLYALRDDKRFEKLVTAMTIDRIAGKSSLAKGKSIR